MIQHNTDCCKQKQNKQKTKTKTKRKQPTHARLMG